MTGMTGVTGVTGSDRTLLKFLKKLGLAYLSYLSFHISHPNLLFRSSNQLIEDRSSVSPILRRREPFAITAEFGGPTLARIAERREYPGAECGVVMVLASALAKVEAERSVGDIVVL